MNGWAVTVFAWTLLSLLILANFAKWAVIIAIIACAAVAAIVITGGIAGAVRRLRRDDSSGLPGPGRHQASGAGDGEDTGVMDALNRDYFALLDKEAGR